MIYRGDVPSSFLSQLLEKEAFVRDLEAKGIRGKAALEEVQRQLRQSLGSHAGIILGEGVTKSSQEPSPVSLQSAAAAPGPADPQEY